jgi:pyruvate formate lyase activating enzyme
LASERDSSIQTEATALVTDIQGYSIHDGPGIRTVVFLKGCGLECWWCANPECISPRPEVGFLKSLCTKCGDCAGVCPNEALTCETGHTPEIDRARCLGCGTCTSACVSGALVVYGRSMTVEEVFHAVERDKMFYQPSGGGVTVSGGEPLLQPRFVRALFEACRQAGIHTCIETSGYAPEAALRQVLPHTDYVLYDLKLQDLDAHRRYTGKSNSLICRNAKTVAHSGVEVLFRMPLIPGITDSLQNTQATTDLMHSLLGERRPSIQLMPYHRLGNGKYESLGRWQRLTGVVSPTPDQVEKVQKAFDDSEVSCTVST